MHHVTALNLVEIDEFLKGSASTEEYVPFLLFFLIILFGLGTAALYLLERAPIV